MNARNTVKRPIPTAGVRKECSYIKQNETYTGASVPLLEIHLSLDVHLAVVYRYLR